MSITSVFLLASWLVFCAAQEFPDCTNGPLASNAVCNTTLPVRQRVQGLVDAMTLNEKLTILHNNSPGVPRLGLPTYNWWGEALHGVAGAPGVNFSSSGNWSYATSFPQPLTMAASFDNKLLYAIGDVISTEARAYNSANRSGLDYWTPNINPFRDPRWGRGQETPGEDTFLIKSYIENMVTGLQGGKSPDVYKIIATCKHYAGYDIEFWHGNNRYGFDAIIDTQDLSEFYMQPFQQCARDTKVGSIMCSYNAVNGVPSCANDFFIDTVLRGHWNWTADENYITSDCTAIQNMFSDHHAFATRQETVAAAINAGVDVDCGMYYPTYLPSAYNESLFNQSTLDQSLIRLYSGLLRTGYFDPAASSPYRSFIWDDVSTPQSEALALKVAEEGMVLLKNDGTLPLSVPEDQNLTVLLAGGWINATTQMQGNYAGGARVLRSPWMAMQNITNLNTVVVQWYESPLIRAQEVQPDVIIYIDATSESYGEGTDRNTIAWNGLVTDAVEMLASTGIPTVVAHMGEQCDDSAWLANANVSSIVWGGYPGMFGGDALVNILFGKVAPSGRLPVTQYPADYVNQVPMTGMSLRPNNSTGNPGRTYKWYDNATIEFGYGLHYTNFSTEIMQPITSSFSIQDLVSSCDRTSLTYIDLCSFLPSNISASSFALNVTNTGGTTSDFVALAFVSGNYGPDPQPLKSLVAYERLSNMTAGQAQLVSMNVTLGGLARYDEDGNEVLYPGLYTILIDVPTQATWQFELTGEQYVLDQWPAPATNKR